MQSPTAQQSWMEGLEGSAGFPPRREAGWGGRGSHLRESVRLSPPSWPHPPRHSWFSQTQEGQGRFLVFFHQRNREPCGAIKWPKIIPREKACLRPRTRGGLSTCFLWEENMKRKWIQSGRSENYKMNGMGFQRESKKKGKKIKEVWGPCGGGHQGQTWIQIWALPLLLGDDQGQGIHLSKTQFPVGKNGEVALALPTQDDVP